MRKSTPTSRPILSQNLPNSASAPGEGARKTTSKLGWTTRLGIRGQSEVRLRKTVSGDPEKYSSYIGHAEAGFSFPGDPRLGTAKRHSTGREIWRGRTSTALPSLPRSPFPAPPRGADAAGSESVAASGLPMAAWYSAKSSNRTNPVTGTRKKPARSMAGRSRALRRSSSTPLRGDRTIGAACPAPRPYAPPQRVSCPPTVAGSTRGIPRLAPGAPIHWPCRRRGASR